MPLLEDRASRALWQSLDKGAGTVSESATTLITMLLSVWGAMCAEKVWKLGSLAAHYAPHRATSKPLCGKAAGGWQGFKVIQRVLAPFN